MRVLFLSCHLPLPPFSGGRRREYELLRRVGDAVDVDLVAVSKTCDEDTRHAPDMRRHCRGVYVVPAVGGPPRPLRHPPSQVRRHASATARSLVADLLTGHSYDLVHVEGFYLVQHLPRRHGGALVLGTQNVEHTLLAQRAEVAAARGARRVLHRDARATRRHERAAVRRARRVLAVTGRDAGLITRLVPDATVDVVPNGADHRAEVPGWQGDEFQRPRLPGVPRVVLVGNFAYPPNADAARFFLADVLPRIRGPLPAVEVLLVGNGPSADLIREAGRAGVAVTGRVRSLQPVLDSADVVVCPLRAGGGVKTKLLEALHAAVPVVTTSVGAQGLSPAALRGMLVADTAGSLAAGVLRVLTEPGLATALRAAAGAAARTLPTWDDAARRLLEAYRSAAGRP